MKRNEPKTIFMNVRSCFEIPEEKNVPSKKDLLVEDALLQDNNDNKFI